MGLFGGPKKNSFLGVDIGTGGIKVVELLVEKGRARLMTYGYSELRPDEAGVSPFDDPKRTGEILGKICRQAGVESGRAIAALPLSSVFSAIISVPPQKDDRLMKEAINQQVRKLTPMPLEEMITYSTFIDERKTAKPEPAKPKEKGQAPVAPAAPQVPRYAAVPEVKKEYVRVLVTGAAKSLVQKYIDIFKSAKLTLEALDTEAFAMIRSLVGKDKSSILVLDIGHLRSNIVISEKGIPFLTRSINVGGATVTKKLVEQLGLPLEQAIQMKMDIGTMVEGGATSAGGLPTVLESVMQPVLNEVSYSLGLYAKMDVTDKKKVEKIVVTGGSAHLPHIADYLSAKLNLNVYVGDPWARVVYPDELRPVLDEIGPRMSAAVGLAMREMEG